MKRKATEPRSAPPAAMEAGAAAAITSLLRRCSKWRDRCGRAFRVERKVERRPECAVVRVARFDRVPCKALVEALGVVSGSGHAVTGFDAVLQSAEVKPRRM